MIIVDLFPISSMSFFFFRKTVYVHPLQYYTPSTAPSMFFLRSFHVLCTISAIAVIWNPMAASRRSWSTRLLLVISTNLTNQVVECFINVDPRFGRCFNEPAGEVVCQITALYKVLAFKIGNYILCTNLVDWQPYLCLSRTCCQPLSLENNPCPLHGEFVVGR